MNQVHNIRNLILLIVFSLCINKVSANSNDSILAKCGLSSEYFDIVLVKDAPKKIFRNLTSNNIKNTDTIIIVKVDTLENIVNIKGKTINYRLVLSGKVFKKSLSFNNTNFKKEVYMNGCLFLDRVDFSKAVFDSTLILWNTFFNKAGVFFKATFHDLQFSETNFEEDVQFNKVKFLGPTHFLMTHFKKGAFFNEAVFSDYASFKLSVFEQSPWFWNTISKDTLVFYSSKFKSGIDFQSSKFGLLLGLSHLESNGRIYFDDVLMPKYTDLRSIKSEKTIDFNYINDSSEHSNYLINIYDVDLNKLILTSQFDLYFDEYLSTEIKHSTYKQLLDYLFQKGYKDIYKSFDIKYKSFVNKHYNNYFEKVFFHINRLWWNFGYNRKRVLIWTLVFIILFSIPIRIWINLFIPKVYEYKKLYQRYNANRKINNVVKRFLWDYWIAFIYTIFVFFNLKLDFEKLAFDKFFASTFILFIYVFGLICTAFIVNLIITV